MTTVKLKSFMTSKGYCTSSAALGTLGANLESIPAERNPCQPRGRVDPPKTPRLRVVLGGHRAILSGGKAHIRALHIVVNAGETLVEARALLLLALSGAHLMGKKHRSAISPLGTGSINCFVGGHNGRDK
jgi:hypothetical protein